MNMVSLWNHPHHNAYPNPSSIQENKQSFNESYSDSEKGIQRKAEEKLYQLLKMQESIDDADFGVCARCNNEIPIGRLLLMPQSRFCVHCASRN